MTADAFLRAVTPSTKAIVINSPCNPTGALMPEREVTRLVDEVADKNIWIVLDLCYEQLIYEPVPHNLVRVLAERMRDHVGPDRVGLEVVRDDGLALRLGARPGARHRACNALQSHSTSNVVVDFAEGRARGADRAAGRGGRDARGVPPPARPPARVAHGGSADRVLEPAGAFYLFLDISELLSPDGIRTSAEFAARLLEENHVALTAGEAFDAPGFLRISYATSLERLREGAQSDRAFVASLDAAGKTPPAVRA